MDKSQEKFPAIKLKANMENNLIIRKNNITEKESNTILFSYISKLPNIPNKTKLNQTNEISQVNDEDSSKNNYPFYDDKMNNINKSKYINYLIFL